MNEDNNNPNPNPAPTPPAPVTPVTPEPAVAPAPETTTPNPEAPTEKDPDEALVEAYIGDNYDKISKRVFNIPAFFFTGMYMIFRKKYLWGIVVIFINLFLQNLPTIFAFASSNGYQIGQIISLIALLGIDLGSAFFFNKFYIKSIHKKIEQLRAQHPGISNDELKGICSSKGGTSVPGLIVSILVMIVVSIISFIIMSFVLMSQAFVSSMQNASVSVGEDGTMHISGGTSYNGAGSTNGASGDNVYNGVLSYGSDYEDIIDVTIPKVFAADDASASFGYLYKPEDGNGNCSMKIKMITNFTDPEKMIESMAEYYDDDIVEPLNTYKKNGLTWNYLGTENVFGKEYRLAADVDGNIVYIEYEMDEELYDKCEEYLWETVDSIEAK